MDALTASRGRFGRSPTPTSSRPTPLIGSSEGVFCEPASAAAVAGLIKHGAEVAGALQQLHRTGVEGGPAGLVDPVGQAAADQGEVVAREAQDEQGGVRHVVDRVLDRHLGGHRRPGLDGGHGVAAGWPAGPRARAAGRAGSRPRRRRSRTRRAARRPRCRGGPPARGPARTRARRARTCGRRRARPATVAAALEPRPAPTGISELMWKVRPSAGCSASKACTQRLVRSQGTPGRLAVDEELAGLLHLELQGEIQRGRQHVVARARGWPWTRARSPPAGASPEHRLLHRLQRRARRAPPTTRGSSPSAGPSARGR